MPSRGKLKVVAIFKKNDTCNLGLYAHRFLWERLLGAPQELSHQHSYTVGNNPDLILAKKVIFDLL